MCFAYGSNSFSESSTYIIGKYLLLCFNFSFLLIFLSPLFFRKIFTSQILGMFSSEFDSSMLSIDFSFGLLLYSFLCLVYSFLCLLQMIMSGSFILEIGDFFFSMIFCLIGLDMILETDGK